jgi:hypothetical protein
MTTVEVQHVVKAPDLKSPWTLDTEVVDGRTYVKLFKWNRDFIRFVHGRALNFGDKSTYCKLTFFDTLLRLRNNACDAALREVLEQSRRDAEEINGVQGSRKKTRKVYRVAQPSDAAVLPAAVQISLPSLDISHPAEVYVLSSGVRSRELIIELSSEILDYIRHGCLKCQPRQGRTDPIATPDVSDRAESAGE